MRKLNDVMKSKDNQPFKSGLIEFDFITREAIFICDGFFELCGYSRDEADNWSGIDEAVSVLLPESKDIINAIFSEFTSKSFRLKLLRKNTDYAWIDVNLIPIARENGQMILSCVFADITKSINLQEKYHRALNQLKLINAAQPAAIFSIKCTRDLDLLYANDYFYNIFNKTREEISENYLNKLIFLFHPHDIDNIYYTLTDCKNDKHPQNTKARIIVNGETRWLSINAVYTADFSDGEAVCQCVLLDETNVMNIMFYIETSRREMEAIANSIPGSISKIVYNEGNIEYLFLSNGLHIISGYTPEDPEYFSIEGIIHPDDKDDFFSSMNEQLEYSSFTITYRVINKDSTIRWVRQSGTLLEMKDNAFTFICVYIDISNIKNIQTDTENENPD